MGTISDVRRHPHLAATVHYLRRCGADDIVVHQTKRVRVAWRHEGERLSISLPTGTRKTRGHVEDVVKQAQQSVRRRYREAGVEVRV